MAQSGQEQWIMPTTGSTRLPTVELLTGRGFVTGKSGSGKSNTASVILEELLELKFNLLIIDIEGEYYGLKDRYDLVHAGADDRSDITVGVSDAADIAELALVMNMPVVLDISEFADPMVARELVTAVVEELYVQEKAVRKPFLLVVEEMQEFMPQTGGGDELSHLLERVAKRGRKRGLGMLGLSQRPSSVDKNFITQCDWMVWHRVTWKTDLDIVRKGQKAQKVCDMAATLAERRGDVFLRVIKPIHELAIPCRLIQGVEIGTLNVLYDCELQDFGVRQLSYKHGKIVQSGLLRRAPTAFARDDLVMAGFLGVGPHDQRLQNPARRDRLGELGELLLAEGAPRLVRVGRDPVDGHRRRRPRRRGVGRRLLLRADVGHQRRETAAEPARFRGLVGHGTLRQAATRV